MYKRNKESKIKEIKSIIKDLEEQDFLDKDEKELLNQYKNIDINLIKDETDKEFKKRKNNLSKIQSKLISIRVNNSTLNKIKNKANSYGLNYQTYINLFLNQLADNKLKIKIN